MKIPTLAQLEAYVKLRNLSVDPTEFLMHYEDSEPPWTKKPKKGKEVGEPVYNWKLTMQSWHNTNKRYGRVHKCSHGGGCKKNAAYSYKDSTEQVYWRCEGHKLRPKPLPLPDNVIPIFKPVPNGKVNKNNERNRQTKALKEK